MKLIGGEHIYLRNMEKADAEGEYLKWMNDPEITKYLESRFSKYTKEDLEKYIEEMNKSSENVFLAIILKSGDVHIGNVKIGPINGMHKFADIGIIIGARDQWGKGYGSEAIELATKYAFEKLELHRLNAGCYSTNIGSAKAFERAGYAKEGVERKKFLSDGNYVDDLLFGKVNE